MLTTVTISTRAALAGRELHRRELHQWMNRPIALNTPTPIEIPIILFVSIVVVFVVLVWFLFSGCVAGAEAASIARADAICSKCWVRAAACSGFSTLWRASETCPRYRQQQAVHRRQLCGWYPIQCISEGDGPVFQGVTSTQPISGLFPLAVS
jgi:hypothetical protein